MNNNDILKNHPGLDKEDIKHILSGELSLEEKLSEDLEELEILDGPIELSEIDFSSPLIYPRDKHLLDENDFRARIEHIIVEEGVKELEDSVFWRCFSLKKIELPDSLISIGMEAFSACSSLTEIILPSGLQEIGYKAFYNCSKLSSIFIPKSVIHMGRSIFENCSSIVIYIEADKKPEGWNGLWNLRGDGEIYTKNVIWGYKLDPLTEDIDYRDVYDSLHASDKPTLGPIFILEDGSFSNINPTGTHSEIFGDEYYESDDFFFMEDEFNLIKASGGNRFEPYPYIDLWTVPNRRQKDAIITWMYFLIEKGKKELQVNTPNTNDTYDLGNELPEDIYKNIIRNL